MHGLYPLMAANNESGEHVTGKAQTLAEIQKAAEQERIEEQTGDAGYAKAQAKADRLNDWPEPRNEH